MQALVPASWFRDSDQHASALLGGVAANEAFIYSLVQFAKAQTRLQTASDGFLDLLAFDYFGLRFQRKPGETDAAWALSIQNELTRARATRGAVIKAVRDLTGTSVRVFEPWNAADTGGFGAAWALNESASAFGSTAYPYTIFITAVEPIGAGIPNLAGLNDAQGGFGAGEFALADVSLTQGAVTNQNIYDTINATRASGITAWVNIGPPPVAGGRLDMSFYLNATALA
ncbi:hypothetical protein DYH55_00300 [Methylovirgula sp. 4M-Z18]|nr:hypothetical protein DYH55_00300 [Methylovirgula sp. 4M-Z18]